MRLPESEMAGLADDEPERQSRPERLSTRLSAGVGSSAVKLSGPIDTTRPRGLNRSASVAAGSSYQPTDPKRLIAHHLALMTQASIHRKRRVQVFSFSGGPPPAFEEEHGSFEAGDRPSLSTLSPRGSLPMMMRRTFSGMMDIPSFKRPSGCLTGGTKRSSVNLDDQAEMVEGSPIYKQVLKYILQIEAMSRSTKAMQNSLGSLLELAKEACYMLEVRRRQKKLAEAGQARRKVGGRAVQLKTPGNNREALMKLLAGIGKVTIEIDAEIEAADAAGIMTQAFFKSQAAGPRDLKPSDGLKVEKKVRMMVSTHRGASRKILGFKSRKQADPLPLSRPPTKRQRKLNEGGMLEDVPEGDETALAEERSRTAQSEKRPKTSPAPALDGLIDEADLDMARLATGLSVKSFSRRVAVLKSRGKTRGKTREDSSLLSRMMGRGKVNRISATGAEKEEEEGAAGMVPKARFENFEEEEIEDGPPVHRDRSLNLAAPATLTFEEQENQMEDLLEHQTPPSVEVSLAPEKEELAEATAHLSVAQELEAMATRLVSFSNASASTSAAALSAEISAVKRSIHSTTHPKAAQKARAQASRAQASRAPSPHLRGARKMRERAKSRLDPSNSSPSAPAPAPALPRAPLATAESTDSSMTSELLRDLDCRSEEEPIDLDEAGAIIEEFSRFEAINAANRKLEAESLFTEESSRIANEMSEAETLFAEESRRLQYEMSRPEAPSAEESKRLQRQFRGENSNA